MFYFTCVFVSAISDRILCIFFLFRLWPQVVHILTVFAHRGHCHILCLLCLFLLLTAFALCPIRVCFILGEKSALLLKTLVILHLSNRQLSAMLVMTAPPDRLPVSLILHLLRMPIGIMKYNPFIWHKSFHLSAETCFGIKPMIYYLIVIRSSFCINTFRSHFLHRKIFIKRIIYFLRIYAGTNTTGL